MKLTRPLIFFDIESTGVDAYEDRIVEISVIKISLDGEKVEITRRFNPGVPIPEGASEIHGIYDKDVAPKPLFKQVAKKLFEFFEGCDLGGFNAITFDVPMLSAEFDRCDIEFPADDAKYIDPMRLYHLKEKRDLSAAYKFYCGEDLEGAHGAAADIQATLDIFNKQIEMYGLPESVDEIQKVCMDGNEIIDLAGWVVRNEEGDLIFNKGKHRGKNTKVVDDQGYVDWIIGKDFPTNTKNKLLAIIDGDLK